jgi:hypothetical protein
MTALRALACLGLASLLAACPQQPVGTSSAPASSTKLRLTLSHVPPISPPLGHYTLWLTGATPSAVQTFLVASDGTLTTTGGQPWDGTVTLSAASPSLKGVQVTQELPTSTDQTPGKQLFLSGSIAGPIVTLAPPAHFDPGSLEGATGKYLLDNPTTQQMNGLCLQDNSTGRPMPGANVPVPPAGWMYETWILLNGHWLALGKFADPSLPDDWNSYSGKNPPPFPGEDFNQGLPPDIATSSTLPDLRGAQVIVSVEAASLQHEEVYPSPLRLFAATVPASAAHDVTYPMTNVEATGWPGGTLTLGSN